MILGTAIIRGTMKSFPQLRLGFAVLESPDVKNIQNVTYRSPRTLA